jgi:diguanylate cyclase (GGDEF)-like protein
MTEIEAGETGLSEGVQQLLDAAFPFHLRLDPALRVVGFGRSLPMLFPGVCIGDEVNAHAWASPIREALQAEHFQVQPGRAVVLLSRSTEVRLRCQVFGLDDGTIMLLGTPWLGSLDDLDRTGLTLGDFAEHDPTPDFMFVFQSQLTALNDARRLADRLRRLESERRHQALHDPLTGVGNRRLFTENLERNLPGACLVIVDVDDFKEVNDTFGHPMGDAVLCAVAQRLRSLTSGEDTIARLGGDEFAVLLAGNDPAARSVVLAHGIVEAMRKPVRLDGSSVSVSVSVGAVPHGDPSVLARNADVALYAAKRGGRGRAVLFDASLHEALLHRFELRDRLGRAVAEGAITVVFQPIIELSNRRVHGFEALARWTDPVLGAVPPDVFIALAEETGMIAELGMFVLETSVRQHGRWRREYPDADLVMSVNLSPRQLDDPDLVDQVNAVLTAHDLPTHSLQLELTESAFTSHSRSTEQLYQLRALGFPLAIDDFGSSESTLARLHAVPATTLKIDRAFLSQLDEAPERSARLLKAVVAIANALELSTVAEGIETDRDHDVVTGAGCNFGQGYLYARPLDSAAADAYLLRELGPRAVPAPRSAQDLPNLIANVAWDSQGDR